MPSGVTHLPLGETNQAPLAGPGVGSGSTVVAGSCRISAPHRAVVHGQCSRMARSVDPCLPAWPAGRQRRRR